MVYFLCKAYDSDRQNCYFARSLPVRGAWIEMFGLSRCPRVRASSLPVRGAWIEMRTSCCTVSMSSRRSPCGERGLKCCASTMRAHGTGRSPCGERGLKLSGARWCSDTPPSLPVRGAWIEIAAFPCLAARAYSRSPCGERGLKLRSTRVARRRRSVAPRAGSVD